MSQSNSVAASSGPAGSGLDRANTSAGLGLSVPPPMFGSRRVDRRLSHQFSRQGLMMGQHGQPSTFSMAQIATEGDPSGGGIGSSGGSNGGLAGLKPRKGSIGVHADHVDSVRSAGRYKYTPVPRKIRDDFLRTYLQKRRGEYGDVVVKLWHERQEALARDAEAPPDAAPAKGAAEGAVAAPGSSSPKAAASGRFKLKRRSSRASMLVLKVSRAASLTRH